VASSSAFFVLPNPAQKVILLIWIILNNL
jgi:hypothetical protein